MGEAALVRASIPKSSWAEIERSPAGQREKIARVLGPTFESELNAALAVSWVPFTIEARIADAVYEALGPSGARVFYRSKTARSFEGAWLRPLMASSLRIFGATPRSFLKMLPRAWTTMSKNCGVYEWEDSKVDKQGISIIRGFPTYAYRRHEAWLESIAGGYEAFFSPFRVEGTVQAEELDFARGDARFILQW